jgi:hypothetical protein
MQRITKERKDHGINSGALFIYGFSSFHESRNIAHPGLLWRIARASKSNSAYMPWCDIDSQGDLIFHKPENFSLPAAIIVDRLALGTLAADAYYYYTGKDRNKRKKKVTKEVFRRMNAEAAQDGNMLLVLLQSVSDAEREEYIQFFNAENIAYLSGELLPKSDTGAFALDGSHPGPLQAMRWAEQLSLLISEKVYGKP